MKVLLGFEVNTGLPVHIPQHHLAITGLTRLSGKTTTVQALISRLPEGFSALVFRTKRGEISFRGAKPVRPFYRQHTDWEYVQSLLEAAMKERLKFERSWIIKSCKGTKTLREVYRNIQQAKAKSTRGLDESVYTNLEAYFDKVLPQLERHPFSETFELATGANVMDLGHLTEEVQALVISACLEEISKTFTDTAIVIPESWKFLPQARGNPVKWAAQHVIREGGAMRVYLWLDSQDITGVTKDVLKSVGVWCMGRQQEINEVRRVLDQVPIRTKPKPEQVMTLPLGHFYVAAEDWCKLVYVQPAWMDQATAIKVAKGELKVSDIHAENEVEEDPMVIKQLEEELATVKNITSKTVKMLGTVTLERDKLLKQVEYLKEEQRKWEVELKDYKSQLEEKFAPLLTLKSALQIIVGQAGPAPLDDIDHKTLDTIAEKVLSKIGDKVGRPVIQVMPLEALKKDFQHRAIEKMQKSLETFTPVGRDALLWLLAVGKPATRADLARGLGSDSYAGNDKVLIDTAVKVAIEAGFIFQDNKWLRPTIREKVVEELKPYDAPEDDVESTYQHLLVELAKNAGKSSRQT